MKWGAVDLDDGTLTVRTLLASTRAKEAERTAGAAAVVLKGMKSGKSRKVPFDRDAVTVLRRVKVVQAAEKLAAKPGECFDQGFVFLDKHGRPFKLDEPTKAFREIADASGLTPEVTLHSLSLVRIVVDRERRRHSRCATLPRSLGSENDAQPILSRRCRRPGEGCRRRQRYPSSGPGEPRGQREMTPRRSSFWHRLHRNCTATILSKGPCSENPHEITYGEVAERLNAAVLKSPAAASTPHRKRG